MKYGKLPANESEEIPWDKNFIYLIGAYAIWEKDRKKI